MTDTMKDTPASAPKKVNWLKRLVPIAIVLLGIGAMYMSGLYNYLSIDTLERKRQYLKDFVSEHLLIAVISYIAVYALATLFMLPGALWITIAGGFLFGLFGGSAVTVTGATLGATMLFLVARTSLGKPLQERAGPFLRKLEAGFREDAFSYMFFLRFFPGIPFPIANIAPALLGARLPAFVITTFFGIMPGVFAYTWIGAGLGGVFDRGEEIDTAGLFTQIAPPLAALAIVSLIPIAMKRFRKTTPDASA